MRKIHERALALLMALIMVLSNVTGIVQTAHASELEETAPVVAETEAPAAEETETVVETTAAPVEETTEPVAETTEAAETEAAEETEAVTETEAAEETVAEETEETEEEVVVDDLDEPVSEEALAAATMSVLDTKVTGLYGEYAEASATRKGTVEWTSAVEPDSGTVTIAGSVVGYTPNGSAYAGETTQLELTSDLDAEAVLTFNYEITTVKSSDSVTFDGVAPATKIGSFEKTMNRGDTVVIALKVTSGSGLNGASIVLKNVRLGANPVIETEFLKAENGTYTVTYGDTTQEITEATKITNKATTNYTLTATPAEGYSFSGWMNTTKGVYIGAGATSENVRFAEPASVVPLFLKTEDAVFAVGDARFADLASAATYAKNAPDKIIILLKNTTLEAGEYVIPSGVTLLIPFDEANTLYTDKPGCSSSKYNNVPWVQPYAYRTLEMNDGAKLTIQGTVSLSSMHAAGGYKTAGSPTGPYGHVDMDSGSRIVVENGGKLYAWGYITGSGKITANYGAEVYENMQATDFRGGSASAALVPTGADDPYLAKKKVFPFSQYYVQNIEVELKLMHGAKESVYTSLYALDDVNSVMVDFIGTTTSMFYIGEGSYVTKDYDPATDRLILSAEGNGSISVNGLSLTLAGVTVSSGMFNLPITSNITININGGSATIAQDMALLPGSQVNIAENASLTVAAGNNVFVYDATEWNAGKFVYNNLNLNPVSYSPSGLVSRTADKDAVVDVNGTLYIGGSLYTTESGANIISSRGTGLIWMQSGAGTATFTNQVTQQDTNITFVDIPITSAKLKNGEGDYTDTSSAVEGSGYGWSQAEKKWVDYVTVTYDSNGAAETVPSVKVAYETLFWAYIFEDPSMASITLPAGPSREGANFLEWNTKRDGSGDSYQPGDAYVVTGNTTLYAIWDIETYTVTWMVDGEQYGEVELYEFGAPITVPAPTKADNGCKKYTFSGWEPQVPATMPSENLTFTGSFIERTEHSGETVMAYNDTETHKVTWSCCGEVEEEAEAHVPYCECGIVTVSAELANAKLTSHTVQAYGEKSVFFAEPGKDLTVKAENTAGTGVALFAADNTLRSFDGTLTVPGAKVTTANDLTITAKATVLVKINLAGGNVTDAFGKTAEEIGMVIGEGFITVPVFYGEETAADFASFAKSAHTLTGAVDAAGEAVAVQSDENGSRIVLAPQADLEITLTWKCDTLTEVAAEAANCTDTGLIRHWACACGKLYLDAEGTQETTLADVTIATNGEHDWRQTGYDVKEEYHFREYVCNHDERHTKTSAAEDHDFNNEEHKCVCGKLNKFTVIFVDAEDQQIGTVTGEYGSDISAEVAQIEEAFAMNNPGMLITHWETEAGEQIAMDTVPGGNMTVRAVYVYMTFEITWIVEGEVWDTDTVYFMQEIEAPVPTKAADGCTAYAFAGWTPAVPENMPSENLTFEGSFEAYTKHVYEEIEYRNVTETTHDAYNACCGDLIATGVAHDYSNAAHQCGCGVYEQITVTVHWLDMTWSTTCDYGTTTSISTRPAHPGYTFVGFAKTEGGEVFLPCGEEGSYPVYTYTENIDLYAVFTMNSFTYTVETYTMGIDGTYGEGVAEQKTADYDTVIDLTGTEVPEGFFLDTDHENSKLQGTVPADNSLVLKVYVARESFKINWVLNGCKETVSLPKTLLFNNDPAAPHDVQISFQIPKGYQLTGFKDAQGNELNYADGVLHLTVTGDMTVEAVVEPRLYTMQIEALEFYGDADYCNYVLTVEVPYGAKLADYIPTELDGVVIYQTGDEIEVNGSWYRGTYTITGWETFDEENGYLTLDLETATMPIGGVTVTQAVSFTGWATWYNEDVVEGIVYMMDDCLVTGTVAHIDGEAYLFGVDGFLVSGAGLWRHVTEEGVVEYYYFCDGEDCVNGCEPGYAAFRNTATSEDDTAAAIHWVSKHNDLLPEWDYAFDARGVILHNQDTSLNGLHDEGEDTVYYIDGVPAYMGLVKIGENYYYVRSNGKIVKNASYWITKTNGLLEEAAYMFDENGVLIPEQLIVKDGIVEENGELYYYVEGVLTYAGLICVDGDYYYVRSNGQLVRGQKYWVTKTNGLLPEDSYTFGEDGKLIFTIEQEKFTGIADGYYYVDGVKTYAGLIMIDGDYYYINSSFRVITGRNYWITKTNGLVEEGIYSFDEDGKMVLQEQEEGLNGIVDGYYYVDGVKTYAGLIEIDGKLYYVNASGKVIMGRKYWITKTNGLMPEGAYEFDETGAMIMN